jgi:hypothetical protein
MDIISIQKTSEVLTNKEALETLKEINDNIITTEEAKNKKKSIDVNLVGWCDCNNITGKESESKGKKLTKQDSEFDKKQAQINDLKEFGLLIEGQHTPLVQGQKAGEPDRLAEPIRKFKLTNEGSAVLSLAESIGLIKNVKKSKDLADEVKDDNPDAASEKGNIRTRADQKREDKESDEATKRTLANQRARKS